eukprot:GHVT01081755.1.p1 GENE.GHVT01081755.1~~GHVT01081755.1.p1  ORF type:complete len:229 (-),score=24.15 GHVT01081755.1:679-1365(-)
MTLLSRLVARYRAVVSAAMDLVLSISILATREGSFCFTPSSPHRLGPHLVIAIIWNRMSDGLTSMKLLRAILAASLRNVALVVGPWLMGNFFLPSSSNKQPSNGTRVTKWTSISSSGGGTLDWPCCSASWCAFSISVSSSSACHKGQGSEQTLTISSRRATPNTLSEGGRRERPSKPRHALVSRAQAGAAQETGGFPASCAQTNSSPGGQAAKSASGCSQFQLGSENY